MIAKKTVRELWPVILVYAAIMEIILVPAIVLWPDLRLLAESLGPVLQLTKYLSTSPLFKQVLEGMSEYRDFYAIQMFFKGANICGSAAALLIGTGLIARERENQTIEFLMTRPVSRSRILFAKFSVAAVGLVVPVFLVAWSGIPLSTWLVDEPLPFRETTLAAFHNSLFLLCILALTTLCSVCSRVQAHAAALAGGFVVVQATLYFIQTARRFSLFKLSDIEVYGPIMAGELDFTTLLVSMELWMAGSVIVVYLVADRLLRRIAP